MKAPSFSNNDPVASVIVHEIGDNEDNREIEDQENQNWMANSYHRVSLHESAALADQSRLSQSITISPNSAAVSPHEDHMSIPNQTNRKI